MRTALFALAIPLLFAPDALAAAERPQDRWILSDLYPDLRAWNADVAKVESELKQFGACRGHLGDSARRFRQCLDLEYGLQKTYSRLSVYSGELEAEDTGNPESQSLNQKAQVIGSKISEETAFVSPEILKLGKARIDAFFRQEPGLAIYRHPIDDILRSAAHTLDAKGESIVAAFALSTGSSGTTFQIFANSDMPWPTVKLSDGREVKLDSSAFTEEREARDRDDRKKVFDAYFGKWKEFEGTLGTMYYGNLKEDTVYSRVRKYPDSLSRALDANNLPRAVYDALIKSSNENLPTLHRYFRLRAKILGISDMRYYDVYPPLIAGGREYPIDEGIRMMLESVKPLGDDYAAAMKKGVESRWMDVYPRPRKQSGAHMAGDAYDVHPFLLINYASNYEGVTTIAHEWGHAMHSYLSNKAQPFATSSYATFVAEIASTLNEALLLDYALKSAKTDDERLLYLGSALEGLRGTFFRQAMFSEFEQKAHAIVDGGEPVTGAELTKAYSEIVRRYHGDAVKIDDLYTIEWACVPHFYNSFYVFQYATSIAAASLFADAILEGRAGARERYLKLISSGASDYPYELVKAAGVDLATRAPYDAVSKRMNRIMDEMEAIVARRAKG